MSKFSAYEYRTQPGFDQSKFEGANQAIPMKTLVIHCFDPRATEIPQKVAEYFGDEVYPGENILDEASKQSGWQHANVICRDKQPAAVPPFALLSVAAMDSIYSTFKTLSWFTTSVLRQFRRLTHLSSSSRSSMTTITRISRRCLIAKA